MREFKTFSSIGLAVSILVGLCFAQNSETRTIVIDIVDKKLQANPSRVTVNVNGSEETIRWTRGRRSVPFRIEFVGVNPCDQGTSRLDRDPALCVITFHKRGTFKFRYRIIPTDQTPHVSPGTAEIFARVRSCGGCP